jgi:soluble lytic murein transglycosylase-like protein
MDSSLNRAEKIPMKLSGDFLIPPRFILLAVAAVSVLLGLLLSKVEVNSTKARSRNDESFLDEDNEKTTEPVQSSSTEEPPKGVIAPLFTPEVQHWEDKIVSWSKDWDIDPNLIATVIQIESCGYPKANSYVGAMGLFQVMPFHFAEGDDPYKPNKNAQRGLSYLKSSLDAQNGDFRLALAGYNGGIYGASQPESTWNSETIRYVYWGTGIYKDAVKGKSNSDRLDEWLQSGGASLCNAASNYLGLQ